MTINAAVEESTGRNPGHLRGIPNMPHSRPGGESWYDLGLTRFEAMKAGQKGGAGASLFLSAPSSMEARTTSESKSMWRMPDNWID
jgi:hypothetical protein